MYPIHVYVNHSGTYCQRNVPECKDILVHSVETICISLFPAIISDTGWCI